MMSVICFKILKKKNGGRLSKDGQKCWGLLKKVIGGSFYSLVTFFVSIIKSLNEKNVYFDPEV